MHGPYNIKFWIYVVRYRKSDVFFKNIVVILRLSNMKDFVSLAEECLASEIVDTSWR
jgi:hypothetical protein